MRGQNLPIMKNNRLHKRNNSRWGSTLQNDPRNDNKEHAVNGVKRSSDTTTTLLLPAHTSSETKAVQTTEQY